MIRAHSVEAVRAAEAAAMAQLPDGELMSRAALGLAEVAAARLDDTDGTTVVGLVGAGDNGGDTLYAVAHLAESGFACAVVLVPAGGRSGVHAEGLAAAEAAGVMVRAATDDPDAAARVVAEADLVLDGIVGIGGRPGLRPAAARLVDAVDDDAWVLAVDLASGLDPAGEQGEDDAVWADETVTFATPKPVHLLPAGEAATGRLTVVDIGIELDDVPAAVERLTWDDVAGLWPVPRQRRRQVLPRRARGRRRQRGLPGRGRAVRDRRRRVRRRDAPLRRHADAGRARPPGRARGRGRAGTGPGLGRRARSRHRRRRRRHPHPARRGACSPRERPARRRRRRGTGARRGSARGAHRPDAARR